METDSYVVHGICIEGTYHVKTSGTLVTLSKNGINLTFARCVFEDAMSTLGYDPNKISVTIRDNPNKMENLDIMISKDTQVTREHVGNTTTIIEGNPLQKNGIILSIFDPTNSFLFS